jgi:hypothetical protein
LTPVALAAKLDQSEAGGIGGAVWLDGAFLVERELLAQKEVFCYEGRRWAEAQLQETDGIAQEEQQRGSELPEVGKQVREACHSQGVPLMRHG